MADYRASVEQTQLSGDSQDGALAERAADHLRIDRVAAAYDGARSAEPGATGEVARQRLRCLSPFFLDQACRPEDREIAEIGGRAEHGVDLGGALLATEREPLERCRLLKLWTRLERSLEPARRSRAAARSAAARRAGATGLVAFLEVEHPRPAESVIEAFAPAIRALDEAVQVASRQRWSRSRLERGDPDDAADVPMLEAGIEHEQACPRERIAGILERTARALGLAATIGRTGTGGNEPWPEARVGPERQVERRLGELGGPTALARGLGGLARAARCTFLTENAGPEAVWADPAFDVAVQLLFRRLVLSSSFLRECRVEPHEPLLDALRLEDALAPRLAWAYLLLATGRDASAEGIPDESVIEETLRRALGGPPTPAHRAPAYDPALWGIAALRGTAYGLLIEERLLTKFGRAWFDAAGAGRWLRETWEAEPLETAESMAAALGLGTIEETPLVDRCRP